MLDFKARSRFEDFVAETLLQFVPLVYAENFGKNFNPECMGGHKTCLLTGAGLYSDERLKAKAVEVVEGGGRVVVAQHGGFYGQAYVSGHEIHEISISDLYLTWGWTTGDPSVRGFGLTKPWKRRGRFTAGESPLLVLGSSPRYAYQINEFPQSDLCYEYFRNVDRLISHLEDEVRRKTRIRPYHTDYGWKEVSALADRFPDMQWNHPREAFSRAIRRSSLVIGTYNATTYLESMLSGIPTVIYWDALQFPLRASAEQHFEKLKSVGIYHETPEAAAELVSSLSGEYLNWWTSGEVQDAVREFLEEYARLPAHRFRSLRSALKYVMSDQTLRSSC